MQKKKRARCFTDFAFDLRLRESSRKIEIQIFQWPLPAVPRLIPRKWPPTRSILIHGGRITQSSIISYSYSQTFERLLSIFMWARGIRSWGICLPSNRFDESPWIVIKSTSAETSSKPEFKTSGSCFKVQLFILNVCRVNRRRDSPSFVEKSRWDTPTDYVSFCAVTCRFCLHNNRERILRILS